jgi:hypothetical protein
MPTELGPNIRRRNNMRYHSLVLSSALAAMLATAGCSRSGSAPEQSEAENQGGEATAPAAPARAPEPKFESIVLPAGTPIEVTVDQAVSSKTSNAGDHFAASVASPVSAGGKEVLVRGAAVSGTVTDSKSTGRFRGNAELSLTLSSVTVAGKRYELKTSEYSDATRSRGKRTALGTGIGAAAGAAIGALAGGGKGAAIGAGAGAGAGVTGAALTGERDVEVPAETKLEFKLSEPVTIRLPLR